MSYSIYSKPKIKEIHTPYQDQKRSLAYMYAMIRKCSRGEIVCIDSTTFLYKNEIINSLAKSYGSNKMQNRYFKPAIKVSLSDAITNEKLSKKQFELAILRTIRLTVYSMKNIHKLTQTALSTALTETLVARKTKYLFITNTSRFFDCKVLKHHSDPTIKSWDFLAQAAGLILIFDANGHKTKNITLYAKGEE